ncbi:MAG: hypothetical protein ACYS9X_16765, partial [Planctomycetota bacterium]
MRRKMSLQPFALLAALAAFSATGCYIMAARPMVPQPDGPPPARTARKQAMGFGASAGFFSTLDSEAMNGLSDGVMWDLQASIWLSEIMAIQFDYGA